MPSVSFNESVVVLAEIKPASEMTEKEHTSLWYQEQEFEQIKLDARRLAIAIQNCHEMNPTNQLSYTNSFSAVYESCRINSQPDPEMMSRLVHWVHAGPNRRGLEKFSMEFLSQQRLKSKIKHVKNLLRLQYAMWDYGASDEEVAESMARSSRKSSQRERLFAFIMASVDRTCVKLDRQHDGEDSHKKLQKSEKQKKTQVKLSKKKHKDKKRPNSTASQTSPGVDSGDDVREDSVLHRGHPVLHRGHSNTSRQSVVAQ